MDGVRRVVVRRDYTLVGKRVEARSRSRDGTGVVASSADMGREARESAQSLGQPHAVNGDCVEVTGACKRGAAGTPASPLAGGEAAAGAKPDGGSRAELAPDLVQLPLEGIGGSPRVLSCSILHPDLAGDFTVNPSVGFAGSDGGIGEPPTVSVRSDDVGRSFVYSKPRRRPTPPLQTGKVRVTDSLSPKGARVVQGAALKAVQVGKPFRAMWTFSVSDDFLADFLPADGFDGVCQPVRSLSAEFRRFWHIVTQYCERNGLERPVYAFAGESESSGIRDYHPHLHLLTSVVVRRTEFAEFASFIESAWGLGSVHMEVIHRPSNAAKYLLKGARYCVKGADGKQGRVWGQRWSCSREVRPVETRVDIDSSESDALEFELLAQEMRAAGIERVKTPLGAVTVRGFYPHDGVSAQCLGLAVAMARGEIEPPGRL